MAASGRSFEFEDVYVTVGGGGGVLPELHCARAGSSGTNSHATSATSAAKPRRAVIIVQLRCWSTDLHTGIGFDVFLAAAAAVGNGVRG